jgi:hypothetical protein
MTREAAELRLRRYLIVLALLSFVATLAELVLQDHTGEPLQLIPFGLCALGLLAGGAALLRPSRQTVLGLRVVMVIVALGGLFGAGIHLLENFEFEREVRPSAAGLALVVDTLKGAAPLLAPGILIFAALIGLAATYYHPLLRKPASG